MTSNALTIEEQFLDLQRCTGLDVKRAVERERELCAQVVEAYGEEVYIGGRPDAPSRPHPRDVVAAIAYRIRTRGVS